jgi:hypothetical protein
MKMKGKFIGVTVMLAIVTFILGRIIWPDPMGMMGPAPELIPGFMFISAWESIAFGIGASFFIFGLPYVKKTMPENKKGAMAALISLTWLLVSWWPHDNMHRVNGMENFTGLLRIEFMFHFTLIIASYFVMSYFWRIIQRRSQNN